MEVSGDVKFSVEGCRPVLSDGEDIADRGEAKRGRTCGILFVERSKVADNSRAVLVLRPYEER